MENNILYFFAFAIAFFLLFLLAFYHNRMDDKKYMELMTNKKNDNQEECVTF